MLHPQWDIFFQVVESGSFARAAAARSCSAVAVMNQVNALEERLGVALLARSTRGVRLTAAGEALHAEARRLARAGAEAIERARAGARPSASAHPFSGPAAPCSSGWNGSRQPCGKVSRSASCPSRTAQGTLPASRSASARRSTAS